jgi:hypothetical protein
MVSGTVSASRKPGNAATWRRLKRQAVTGGCGGAPQPADNDVDSSESLLTPSLLDENRYRSGGVSQQQSGRALDEGGRNRRQRQA